MFTFEKSTVDTTLQRHRRDLWLKNYFRDATLDNSDYNPRLYVKSSWNPPKWKVHNELKRRFTEFSSSYRSLFVQKDGQSNLLPSQRLALRYLKQSKELIIVPCDKNLGPALIKTSTYIKLAIKDHLHCRATYRQLSAPEATSHGDRIRDQLTSWLKKWKPHLLPNERRFIKNALNNPETDPISTFYLLMKVHKQPLATRPIVSCSGTLLHALGIWVGSKLQRVAQRQHSYFKSSAILKNIVVDLSLSHPQKTTLFTADAVSMYTNIDTTKAITSIAMYLHRQEQPFHSVPNNAIIEALRLIMNNNIFRFGDTFWHQRTGTAMGTPPAPTYATIYFAIHEEELLEEFKDNLIPYKRFIDDIFGIWIVTDYTTDQQTWLRFQKRLNDYNLCWEVSDCLQSVNFMDITVKIHNDCLQTTLYHKALNPYLYIPPHSAHPPGVLTGLVFGSVHRIYTLCSEVGDQQQLLNDFYRRLLVRGYKAPILLPLFRSASVRFNSKATKTIIAKNADLTDSVFIHLPYHPNNPKSHEIQKLWQDIMLHPKYKRYLNVFTNTNWLTVAYSRPQNLGESLSSRIVKTHDGPPVSSYIMITNQAGAAEREIEIQRERERENESEIEIATEKESFVSTDAASNDIVIHRRSIFSQFANKN